ncbi:MAG TPA: hypothetical protein VN848_08660 [Gemmatimonadales bacterium]|nr:hypothetical protein [Gemmatimonadales bacterium]
MFRNLIGFAVFAIVAWLVLRVAFGLLSGLIGLAVMLLWLAAIGFGLYLVLRLISPTTADRVRELIRGKGRPAGA